MIEAKTYWEKRSALAENYTYRIIEIIGGALPHIQQQISNVDDSWNRAIKVLDTEFGDE